MELNGVVNLHKEKGFTSQDAIRVLRGILKADKVGHTGTLDPDATGVLPVCLGKATRCAELITGLTKRYEAEVAFGAETDTQDASGTVLKTFDYTVDEKAVREACASFIGEISQIPPMYSALKKDGKRLYDLARRGITVEREARKIHIYDLKVLSVSENGCRIDVTCSKGTYIRTLCEDLGRKLGYGAHMKSLVRTASGPYTIDKAYTLKEVEAMVNKGEGEKCLQTLDSLFASYPVKRVEEGEDKYLKSGNFLTYPVTEIDQTKEGIVRMELSDGTLAALYKVSETLEFRGKASVRLKAYKMFI